MSTTDPPVMTNEELLAAIHACRPEPGLPQFARCTLGPRYLAHGWTDEEAARLWWVEAPADWPIRPRIPGIRMTLDVCLCDTHLPLAKAIWGES